MRAAVSVFERIFAKAHHQISGDDLKNYNTDFTGLLISRDSEMKATFHEISQSLMTLFERGMVNVFVMFYDEVAFCVRFCKNGTLSRLNPRMIAEALLDLPQSKGKPEFIIGSDEATCGMSWTQVDVYDEAMSAEIFPLIDFEGVCFYYARLRVPQNAISWITSSESDGSQTCRGCSVSSELSNPLTARPI